MKGPEYALQSQIAELAHLLGWETIAFRPALTKRGYRTPGTGSMARGWPDMTLVRARDRRLIFAELKSDVGRLSDDQKRVLDVLRALEGEYLRDVPGGFDALQIEVHVWKPKDFDRIQETLR